mmetsp:Transcript_401/g.1770  ORF Transcript_401/g.1770 Transcript_401/m.1770 type:complete len:297 (-) Transcript_401:174-1064(-)
MYLHLGGSLRGASVQLEVPALAGDVLVDGDHCRIARDLAGVGDVPYRHDDSRGAAEVREPQEGEGRRLLAEARQEAGGCGVPARAGAAALEAGRRAAAGAQGQAACTPAGLPAEAGHACAALADAAVEGSIHDGSSAKRPPRRLRQNTNCPSAAPGLLGGSDVTSRRFGRASSPSYSALHQLEPEPKDGHHDTSRRSLHTAPLRRCQHTALRRRRRRSTFPRHCRRARPSSTTEPRHTRAAIPRTLPALPGEVAESAGSGRSSRRGSAASVGAAGRVARHGRSAPARAGGPAAELQ